jgi:hypothetical protein
VIQVVPLKDGPRVAQVLMTATWARYFDGRAAGVPELADLPAQARLRHELGRFPPPGFQPAPHRPDQLTFRRKQAVDRRHCFRPEHEPLDAPGLLLHDHTASVTADRTARELAHVAAA